MKRDNRLYTILCVAFVVLLSLPWLQMKTQLFKIRPLQGSFNIAEKKPLTLDSYRDGSYQKSVEDYLSDHFGFREWAFRTYNQYLWSCYGLWNTTCIRLGQDRWLYYLDDVNDYYYGLGCYYNPDSLATLKIYENDSRQLYWMQEILRDYGVNLFVCMAPSKSMTCPEHIADPIPGYGCNHPKAYPYYVQRFEELGLNHLDYNAYFAQLKGQTSYPLYYKFSSHWTNLAVCYLSDTLLRYMEQLGGMRLPHVQVGPEYEAAPVEPDDDMVEIVNVWWPIERQTYRYADVTMQYDEATQHPRLLVVGDSYNKSFHNMLPFDSIFSQYHYWYYFHDIERDPNHDNVDQVDILDEVLNIDYLMLVWCPINIYKLGHGFPERALISLCVDDSVVAARYREEVAAIQADPAQREALRQQAAENGWREKEAIAKEVYKRFYAQPDLYFEELRGEAVPATRNRRIAQTMGAADLPDIERRRGEVRREIINDLRWAQYVRRMAEEELISHEEAFAREVEWVLRHPHMTERQQAVKRRVIEIYTDEPWLANVADKAKASGTTLDAAVWAEARASL